MTHPAALIGYFASMTSKLARLASSRSTRTRHGIDGGRDSVAEFSLWFIRPYAGRHGLEIDARLRRFLEWHAKDSQLEMEDDDWTSREIAAAVEGPLMTQSSARGFRRLLQLCDRNCRESA